LVGLAKARLAKWFSVEPAAVFFHFIYPAMARFSRYPSASPAAAGWRRKLPPSLAWFRPLGALLVLGAVVKFAFFGAIEMELPPAPVIYHLNTAAATAQLKNSLRENTPLPNAAPETAIALPAPHTVRVAAIQLVRACRTSSTPDCN
jgi:hypothetical protein